MKEQIKQMGLKLSAFERKFCDSVELAHRDTLYIKDMALEAIDYINNQLTAKNVSPTQMLVAKTKQYIQENYMKDISLEEVANKVFLNPAYLSRIFKQQEGETFTDYLTKVRIKKAEELLMQRRFKLNDICLMTGFKNSRYFCKVFKLQTGFSPKEYSYKCLFTDGGNDDE
jgi:two-component system response regulator YesN